MIFDYVITQLCFSFLVIRLNHLNRTHTSTWTHGVSDTLYLLIDINTNDNAGNKTNQTTLLSFFINFGYGSAVCTSTSFLFVDLLKNSNDFDWTISLDELTTTGCLYMSNMFMDGARYVSAWPVKVTIFWIIRKIICYLYSNLMINLNACIRSAFVHDAKRSETLFKSIICPLCVFISYFNIDILMSLSSMKWLWFVSAHLVCQRRASQSITSLFLFHFYWRWLLGAYCMIANTERDRECTSMWMNQYSIRWAYVVVVNLLWRGYKHWSSWIRAGAVVAVICVCVSSHFKCIIHVLLLIPHTVYCCFYIHF